ncbi:MAG TPA: TonB-dependent receptor [Bryobacteraceae bacterium]|nr:TonB-dependent receptor [Bryobacteraceae bacterium]
MIRGALASALWIAACTGTALGQLTTAEIAGSVRDSQGLAVPSAMVNVTNQGTGQQFTAAMQETGDFLLRSLPVGQYSMDVEAAGFKKFRRENIRLTAGQVARVNVQLEIGALTEAVTVTSDVPPVDTQTGTLATLVDERRVVDLPLNGRNVLSLASLTPGINRVATANGPSSGQQSINVNGNRTDATNVMLDGASMYYAHRGAATTQPPPDAVQEVKIATNGIEAEFKRGAAAITTITRSGTNEFHGSVWNYMRNDAFDARSFFAARVSKLRYNQFGAAGGGPIRRNKAFFFASYQGLRNPSDQLVSSAFPPTAAERAGDFSNTIGRQPNDPLTNQPFPGGVIPSSRMDPIALKLLERIPEPNRSNGNYVIQVPRPNNGKMIMGRVDYDFTPGDRTSVRYFIDNPENENAFPNGSNVDGYGHSTLGDRSQNTTVSHVHTFSPSVIMNVRASYGRFRYYNTNTVRETLSSLGARFIVAGGPGSLPLLTVPGRFTAGAEREGDRISDTYEIGGTVSWFRGRHEVKFGADVQKFRFYFGNADRSNGEFTFDGSFTGNALADYVLGQPVEMWQQSFKDNDTRYYAPGFFVQDRWRATPKLTLSFGFRWDIITPWRMVNTAAFSLVPGATSQYIPAAPAGILYDRDSGYPHKFDGVNPAPRIGFAYDVFGNGKTSVRGAYGISYVPLIGQMANQNAQPFGFDVRTRNVGPLSDPYRFIDNPFGSSVDLTNPVYSLPISMAGSWAGETHTPYVQNFNFTIEQQVAPDTAVQLSYVGSLGRFEGTVREQNPAVYIPGNSTTQNTDSRRLYAPVFGSITGYAADGNSSYHALQIQVSRRFQKGLTYSAYYTFSKAIDEASRGDAANNWNLQDPFDRRQNRALSDLHRAHRFVSSWVWELPFWRQQRSLVAKILGGWQFAGIATFSAGAPVTVTAGRDNSLTGAGNNRPDVLGDPHLSADRPRAEKLQRYFDTTRFVHNQPGTYGNAARNILIGPGLIVFDLSMGKHFAITETRRIEFRWDAFNAFNRPNFNAPGANLNAPSTFGRITGAGAGRIMQGALRFEF